MTASNRPGVREHAAKAASHDWDAASWKQEDSSELADVQRTDTQFKARLNREEVGSNTRGVPDWQSLRDPASLAAVRRFGLLIWLLVITCVAASGIIWWLLLT